MLAGAQMLTGAWGVKRGCDGGHAGVETAVSPALCAGVLSRHKPAQVGRDIAFLKPTVSIPWELIWFSSSETQKRSCQDESIKRFVM
jgi:hypothetical protein